MWLPVVGIALVVAGLFVKSRGHQPPPTVSQRLYVLAKELSRTHPKWQWVIYSYHKPTNTIYRVHTYDDKPGAGGEVDAQARNMFNELDIDNHDLYLFQRYLDGGSFSASRGKGGL